MINWPFGIEVYCINREQYHTVPRVDQDEKH